LGFLVPAILFSLPGYGKISRRQMLVIFDGICQTTLHIDKGCHDYRRRRDVGFLIGPLCLLGDGWMDARKDENGTKYPKPNHIVFCILSDRIRIFVSDFTIFVFVFVFQM
jgi:hypothetical protein